MPTAMGERRPEAQRAHHKPNFSLTQKTRDKHKGMGRAHFLTVCTRHLSGVSDWLARRVWRKDDYGIASYNSMPSLLQNICAGFHSSGTTSTV